VLIPHLSDVHACLNHELDSIEPSSGSKLLMLREKVHKTLKIVSKLEDNQTSKPSLALLVDPSSNGFNMRYEGDKRMKGAYGLYIIRCLRASKSLKEFLQHMKNFEDSRFVLNHHQQHYYRCKAYYL